MVARSGAKEGAFGAICRLLVVGTCYKDVLQLLEKGKELDEPQDMILMFGLRGEPFDQNVSSFSS